MKSWYDSDEAKALRKQNPEACATFVTTMDQGWAGPAACINCGHGKPGHDARVTARFRALQVKTPGEYIGQLDAAQRRRFNRGDTVDHQNFTVAQAWSKGTIEEVKLTDDNRLSFRVVFPDAKFDPQIAGWPRVPTGDGVWLESEDLRLVKRAPVVIATLGRDSASDGGALKAGLWNEGHHVLEKEQSKLYNAQTGGRLSTLLSEWTVCPNNDSSSCLDRADVEMCATHPDRGTEKVVVKLCLLGVLFNCNCPQVK